MEMEKINDASSAQQQPSIPDPGALPLSVALLHAIKIPITAVTTCQRPSTPINAVSGPSKAYVLAMCDSEHAYSSLP